jgi:hypothetical protein
VPLTVTPRRRHPKMEPIGYDELMSNAGMSGFVSFLIPGPEAPVREEAVVAIQPSRPSRKGPVRKALMAEDGHSLAEQAVYESLWAAALPLAGAMNEDRTIRIGYHRLGQLTRLSWVSVKNNLRSLERKLAIEVTGSENSATREGKCYRIYARQAIVERRRKAGLEWVRRSRGVELLKKAP